MTVVQQVISIAIAAIANFFTRVVPFLVFGRQRNGKEEVSPFIEGLGNFLPPAIMGMLVVYCFRNVHFLSGNLVCQKLLLVSLQFSFTYEGEACAYHYWWGQLATLF